MRVAFVGKGGSGKSTTCAAFIRYLNKETPVLAIDADVNRHLPAMLGFDKQPPSLALNDTDVSTYLKGGRTDIEKFVSTTPPSHQSNLISPASSDPFIQRYALKSDTSDLALLSVGRYEQSDVGDSCYHGKLYTLAAILHHTVDTQSDWIVADSTAGTDGLATSLYYAYDAYVYVVEPTVKSIQVYKDFLEATQSKAKPVYVVVNKADEQDMSFIKQHIDAKNILAVIPPSNELRLYEQGDTEAFNRFCIAIEPQLKAIKATLQTVQRDYDAYYAQLVTLHNELAQKWANTYYQATLDFTPSKDFHYAGYFSDLNRKAA